MSLYSPECEGPGTGSSKVNSTFRYGICLYVFFTQFANNEAATPPLLCPLIITYISVFMGSIADMLIIFKKHSRQAKYYYQLNAYLRH